MTEPTALREVSVGRLEDLSVGSKQVVDVAGKRVLLMNVSGSLHAIDEVCRHKGGPLGDGAADAQGVVTCPWHAWQWDVTSGACVANPQLKTARYAVTVRDGEIWIDSTPLVP